MFIERKGVYKTAKQRRPLYGVGINDADYVTSYKDAEGKQQRCPYYSVWAAMIERCFSPAFHKKRPSYKGCTMDESWKRFSIFKTWMQSQDWQGKELDKDLISGNAKHYGPETCLFINPALNNLLCLRKNDRGALPIGVSRMVIGGKHEYFVASCSFYGKQKRLGYFKTVNEAAEEYKKAKLAYIKELAKKEINPRIKQALLNIW